MVRRLMISTLILTAVSFAKAQPAPKLGPLEQSKTFADAKQYCLSRGSRLPTARELARLAMSCGAKGILEVKEYRGNHGYKPIAARDGSQVDNFYYNPVGFVCQNWGLWSSSISEFDADDTVAYSLEGGAAVRGLLWAQSAFRGNNFRCVVGGKVPAK